MRKNTKLTFTKKKDRPTLSIEEVRYWKRILDSIIKVGFEHEFNLKEPDGQCDGSSIICPCNHPKKEESKCYAKCKLSEGCKLKEKYDCPSIYCVEFVSPCPTCKNAVRDCSKCVLYNNPEFNPDSYRKRITEQLKPTNDLSKVGEIGTLEVTTDGSLLGGSGDHKGVEVTTVGRRVSYDSFYQQSKSIIDNAIANGAYVNERCSVHVHLVAGYFQLSSMNGGSSIKAVYKKGQGTNDNFTELEKDMPEIILSNFHQLIRRYHNALVWLTSSGNSYEHLTRWAKFRTSLLPYGAVNKCMYDIRDQISGGDGGYNGRYCTVNYSPVVFRTKESIKRFHIEVRFADGLLSPSAVASIGVLFHAFIQKAIVLSQHGIVHGGDKEYLEEARKIETTLLNNNASWGAARHSQTQNFEPYREIVRRQAMEMVDLLKPELLKHGRSYQVLRSLAEMPCSMRLCAGETWEKIEADLCGQELPSTKTANDIMSFIDTSYIDDCLTTDEWVEAAAEEVKVKTDTVKPIINKLKEENIITWDSLLGSFVRC